MTTTPTLKIRYIPLQALHAKVNVPFPSRVVGSGAVAIEKNNGIWTVELDIANLSKTIPLTSDYANDFLLIYKADTKTFWKASLSDLQSLPSKNQRIITTGDVIVGASDWGIILNKSGSAGDVTINPASGETIFGLSTWTFSSKAASGTTITLPSVEDRVPEGMELKIWEWNDDGSGLMLTLTPNVDKSGWLVG